MITWLSIIVPGAIGATVAGVGHLVTTSVTYGRFQQRQDDHERRIKHLEFNQLPSSALQAFRELMEAKLNGMQELFLAKIDAVHVRLDTMADRRTIQNQRIDQQTEQDRRVS